jgi:hypothetical protein
LVGVSFFYFSFSVTPPQAPCHARHPSRFCFGMAAHGFWFLAKKAAAEAWEWRPRRFWVTRETEIKGERT